MNTTPDHAATGEFRASNAYRNYALWLLFAVYTVNFIDRQILATLNEPIKAEFGLTDTQLGFLATAFALLYATLGLPIARWADRGNRVNIITIAIVVWSVFTALTAGARSALQLVLARVGVGIGEAGCNPPAYSIISDYFEKGRRATALSIYSLGVYGGILIGSLVGSRVAAAYGWRTAFLVVGIPGLLLAAIVKLTLRDPPRGWSDGGTPVPAAPPPVMQVLGGLWAKRSFRHVAVAAGLHAFAAYGVGQFYVSFFMRTHQMTLVEAAQWIGILTAAGGFAGTYFGGVASDFFANRRNDIRYYALIPGVLLLINVVVGQFVYAIDNTTIMLAIFVLYVALSASYLAPSIAITHRLVTARERALASALLLFILNLIGMGLGPVFAGYLSDVMQKMFLAGGTGAVQASADGLRWSLRLLILINVFAVYSYFRAAKTLRKEAVN